MKEEILINPCNTPTEKFINCEPFKIILTEEYISFFQSGYVERDDDLGEIFFLDEIVYEKSKVSAVEIYYHHTNEQYKVSVYCMGVSSDDDIRLYIDDIKIAQDVYFKIRDWKFSK